MTSKDSSPATSGQETVSRTLRAPVLSFWPKTASIGRRRASISFWSPPSSGAWSGGGRSCCSASSEPVSARSTSSGPSWPGGAVTSTRQRTSGCPSSSKVPSSDSSAVLNPFAS